MRLVSLTVTVRPVASLTLVPAARTDGPASRASQQSVTHRIAQRRAMARSAFMTDSLGQDQLVLRGQPKPVRLLAVHDGDLAGRDEQLAAVDAIVEQRNAAVCSGRTGRVTDSRALFRIGRSRHRRILSCMRSRSVCRLLF